MMQKSILCFVLVTGFIMSAAKADFSSTTQACDLYLNLKSKFNPKSEEIVALEMTIESYLGGVDVDIIPEDFPNKINDQRMIDFFKYNTTHLSTVLKSLNIKVLRLGKKRFNRLELPYYPTEKDLRVVEMQIRNLPVIDYIPWLKKYPFDMINLEGQFLELEDLIFFRRLGFKNI